MGAHVPGHRSHRTDHIPPIRPSRDAEPKAPAWERLLILCGGSALLWALIIAAAWALLH